jgi:hypothetical protein
MMPLIVSAPPSGVARLRFVTTKESLLSKAIRFNTTGSVSHVEAVMCDGTIITSLIGTGVARCPIDYDTSSTLQIMVDLTMPGGVYDKWVAFLEARIGWPYDTPAIVGFAVHLNEHEQGALICSALQVDALRHCGWFAVPLAQKYHQISPVVLLMMLQADPRNIVHPRETFAAAA